MLWAMSEVAREPSAVRGVGSAAYTGLNGTGLTFLAEASAMYRFVPLLTVGLT